MSNTKSDASKENSVFEDPESPDLDMGKKLPSKEDRGALSHAIEKPMDEKTNTRGDDPARERSR